MLPSAGVADAPVAVVIPALNEQRSIRDAVESAWRAGAALVVVSDGGSNDQTCTIAKQLGASVLRSGPPRGRQLNLGAAAVPPAYTICFLHADSTLPETASYEIQSAIGRGRRHGGFVLRFREHDVRLRIAERLINLRTRAARTIWGDQAQFFEASAFRKLGGYREMPIMEDYEMNRRARSLGRPAIIETPVTTSGRRFLERGLVRTTTRNWLTILRYHAGVPVEKLAEEYRRP